MTPTAIERTTLEMIIKFCRTALGEVQTTPEQTLKAIYDLGFRDGQAHTPLDPVNELFSAAGDPDRQAYIREVINNRTGKRAAWEGSLSLDGPWIRFADTTPVFEDAARPASPPMSASMVPAGSITGQRDAGGTSTDTEPPETGEGEPAGLDLRRGPSPVHPAGCQACAGNWRTR